MARPRLTRVLIVPVALSTIAAGMVLSPLAGSASADISTKITSAKAQLAKLQNESEIAAEAYDNGRIALAAANRTSAQMQAKAVAAAARLAKAQEAVAAIATLAYSQGGSSDTTLLYESSDPTGFVDRAALVDSLSHNDVAVLGSVKAAQLNVQSTRRAASQAAAAAAALVAGLARDKAQVEASAGQQSKLLDGLVATQKAEIRQAQIALAKAIAEKRAADIKRYRTEQAQAQADALALEKERSAQRAEAEAFAAQKDTSDSTSASKADVGDSSGSGASSSTGDTSGSGDTSASGSVGSSSSSSSSSSGSGSSDNSAASGSVGGSSGSSGAAETAVHAAYAELGKPYEWAASGPSSFDCSGLTMHVYAQAGVYLPHSSSAQSGDGRSVSQGELLPGDLVFFGHPIHHVGIYVGGGDMIEAPEAGEDVRVSSIYRGDYAGAVRPTG